MTGFLTRARSNIPDEHLGAALFTMGSCCFAVMDMFAKLLGDVKGIQVVSGLTSLHAFNLEDGSSDS